MSPNKKWLAAVVAAAVVFSGGFLLWQHFREPPLPPGFASGNGRIEATEVDITVKTAGRLAEVMAREGDLVEKGQVVARMDVQELEAQYRQAQAQVRQAQEGVRQAQANVVRYRTDLALSNKTLARSQELVGKGFISKERLDQALAARDAADATLQAATVGVAEAEAAVKVAEARVEQIKANLDDSTLKTPIGGRVLYRLAEPGEVLASGGKVLTVLDLTDVYLTLYLPTDQAGRVTVGSDARIILDAAPQYVIPARVSFVAPRSQFTPREVETRTEREKLMFRVKVRIAPELLREHVEKVKTGLPGVAYVQLDSHSPWPERLQAKLPK